MDLRIVSGFRPIDSAVRRDGAHVLFISMIAKSSPVDTIYISEKYFAIYPNNVYAYHDGGLSATESRDTV